MASFGWWNGSTGETTLTASLLFPQPPAHTTFQMLLLDLKQKWERKPSQVKISGWYSLCSGRFALAHFVLLILFWVSFCIGLLCSGQLWTVAHFVLNLLLHQLIVYWTILHYGQFCTDTNFELAYYALDSFVLGLNLHWLLYWAELAVLAYLSTKLSKT